MTGRPRFDPCLPGIRYGVLDELIGYALRRAQITVYEDFARAVADPWVTPQRFAALVLVAENPGIGQTKLGRTMGIARSGAMALINDLAARDWVERRPDPADKRANGLYATASGRAALKTLTARVAAHDRALQDKLGVRAEALRALLMRLADGSTGSA